MTSEESVANAAQDVEAHEGHVDLLINNAGIVGSLLAADALGGPEAMEVLDTNVVGVVRVTRAFLPLLERSEDPAVINLSSGMGSIALTNDPERPESQTVVPSMRRRRRR